MVIDRRADAMTEFGVAYCRRRYHELRRMQPQLFTNPPGLIYEILIRPEDVTAAQDEARRVRAAEGATVEDMRIGVLAEDPYATMLREAVRFPDGSLGLYNRILVPA